MKAEIIRSNRKSVTLQVRQDGSLLIRAPLWYREKDAEALLQKHRQWIEKTRAKMAEKTVFPQDAETIDLLKKKALAVIPAKVEHYSKIMELYPKEVKIGRAKGRFGSCSSKGNLNFSCYLMLYPEEAIDYVVVHELAHLKCRGHDHRFYNLVAKYMPDYKEREKLLKK